MTQTIDTTSDTRERFNPEDLLTLDYLRAERSDILSDITTKAHDDLADSTDGLREAQEELREVELSMVEAKAYYDYWLAVRDAALAQINALHQRDDELESAIALGEIEERDRAIARLDEGWEVTNDKHTGHEDSR